MSINLLVTQPVGKNPVRKQKCSAIEKHVWKFVTDGWEFATILRSLEQFLEQNTFLSC